MMQPVVFDGQLMVATVVTALFVTLKNMWSVLPLLNSVIGEQPTLAVVSVGPTVGVVLTNELPLIGIGHNALTPLLVLHAYKFPVSVPEL
jgi:hypothetical protein